MLLLFINFAILVHFLSSAADLWYDLFLFSDFDFLFAILISRIKEPHMDVGVQCGNLMIDVDTYWCVQLGKNEGQKNPCGIIFFLLLDVLEISM